MAVFIWENGFSMILFLRKYLRQSLKCKFLGFSQRRSTLSLPS